MKKADISYPLEASLEEAERGYNICGYEVASLRTYAEIIRHDLLYQQAQKEERGGNWKGEKELHALINWDIKVKFGNI